MNTKLWGIVVLILSVVILMDVAGFIEIGRAFELVLVAGLVVMLVVLIRSRSNKA